VANIFGMKHDADNPGMALETKRIPYTVPKFDEHWPINLKK